MCDIDGITKRLVSNSRPFNCQHSLCCCLTGVEPEPDNIAMCTGVFLCCWYFACLICTIVITSNIQFETSRIYHYTALSGQKLTSRTSTFIALSAFGGTLAICIFCVAMYRFVEGMTMFNKYVENKVEFFRMVDQLEFPGDILESVSALVSNIQALLVY